MKTRLTGIESSRFLRDPKRTPLKSRAYGNRHCHLWLAKARRRGLNPKQYLGDAL